MHYVYIVWSETRGKFYIGSTSDVEKRIDQHNTSNDGFTQTGRPWKLVYKEEFDKKTEALKREKRLKKMKSARYIRSLIQKGTNSDA